MRLVSRQCSPRSTPSRQRGATISASPESARPYPGHGERYDTLPDIGALKSHNVTLATEKRGDGKGAKTKLKCKLHNFAPELLYDRVEKSWCYPCRNHRKIRPKFKLEQDIHFDNCKYCATGYVTIPGRDHWFTKVADFLPFFPRLAKVPRLRAEQALVKVKDWQGDWKLRGALVTRRDTATGAWEESEFSFKIKQRNRGCSWLRPAAGWDYGGLQTLGAIYREMAGMSSLFIQAPSIFTFADPVSSLDIRIVER